jgi:type II secretory pathway component PulF
MKLDEFAFVNQQLAGMLRSGIPLEGALRQVCRTMRRGDLRVELEALEADLRQGAPLAASLDRRKLPAFYAQMIRVGVQSNDLPGVLTLLADYYQRGFGLWMRLKGLVVYPLIVLFTTLAMSVLMALLLGRLLSEDAFDTRQFFGVTSATAVSPTVLALQIWTPVVILAFVAGAAVLVLRVPAWRRALRWRIPAFKEAGLAQLASAVSMMLQNGCSLNQALALVRQLETGTPAQAEIEHWEAKLASGCQRFPELVSNPKIVPPLFTWLVAGSGEDWAGGFRHAAQVFHERALHRVEMFLYAVLPASVVALGLLILTQVLPVASAFRVMFQMLDAMGEGME